MVNASFAQWAKGYSGCDGGNLSGGIWLCGIEYGGGGDSQDDLNFDEDVGKPHSEERTPYDFFAAYPYNRNAVKLLCALAGHDVEGYEQFYQSERCFHQSSAYFKLNLYPIGFKDTSGAPWQDWHKSVTGFETKQEYLNWCQVHRFPVLREWVRKYEPKVVICTGIENLKEFFSAFGDGSELQQTEDTGEKPISYIVTNAGKTLVAVTYFLGQRHGLNSNERLSSVGRRLRVLVDGLGGRPGSDKGF